MSETHVKEFQAREGEREKQLADLKSKSVEERLALLEEKVLTEDERLYTIVFPEIDEQINRAISNSYDVGDKANARAQAGVDEARAVVSELQQTVNAKLAETVRNLVAQSSSKVVAEALKGQVLVVRQASREELKAGGAIVVRNATREELHKKN